MAFISIPKHASYIGFTYAGRTYYWGDTSIVTWNYLRDLAGTSSGNGTALAGWGEGDLYQHYLYRGYYAFDVSDIPVGSTIDIVKVKWSGAETWRNDKKNFSIGKGIQAATIVNATHQDHKLVAAEVYATWTNPGTGGPHTNIETTLNATGKAFVQTAVDAAGIAKFTWQFYYDAANVPWISGDSYDRIQLSAISLEVTYTEPASATINETATVSDTISINKGFSVIVAEIATVTDSIVTELIYPTSVIITETATRTDSIILHINGILVDIWKKVSKVVSSWTKVARPTAAWTKTAKTTSTWTKVVKTASVWTKIVKIVSVWTKTPKP